MSVAVDQAVTPAVSQGRRRPRFFLAISLLQLLVVFLGFAPTFYLDPLFVTRTDEHPMPAYLIVHAVLLTAWYAGLVVQSGLIVRRRLDLHKTLGFIGVAVAIGVVLTGIAATLLAIPRAVELGYPPRPRIDILVTTNTMNLLVFVALVSVAVYKRANPQTHKRLLLIASLAIIGPAVGPDRMFGFFLQSFMPFTLPIALFFWLVLVVIMGIYDVVVSGRVHPATLWGGLAKAAAVATTITLAQTGLAAEYVNWLERLRWLG